MDKISLKGVIPNIFSDAGELNSGIWNINTGFVKGNSYLIESESGRGKSSFCSYLYGYRTDYSGDIRFDDANINNLSGKDWDNIRKRHLSLLFQDLALFPELTALENVILKNRLTNYKTIDEISDMFELLNISDKINEKASLLSWGQQQRVAIIRSLCQPFDFLLLDEPVSHLDDRNGKLMASLIEDEVLKQGAGIIVTSIGKHLPLNYTNTIAL